MFQGISAESGSAVGSLNMGLVFGGVVPPGSDALLLEDGFYFLLEDGFKLLFE